MAMLNDMYQLSRNKLNNVYLYQSNLRLSISIYMSVLLIYDKYESVYVMICYAYYDHIRLHLQLLFVPMQAYGNITASPYSHGWVLYNIIGCSSSRLLELCSSESLHFSSKLKDYIKLKCKKLIPHKRSHLKGHKYTRAHV